MTSHMISWYPHDWLNRSWESGWWFETFFIFHFIYGMSSQPHWRTPWFFKMVQSTSQLWVKPFQLSSGSDELSDWIEPFSTIRSPLELQSFPTIWIHIMDPYESIWIHLTNKNPVGATKNEFLNSDRSIFRLDVFFCCWPGRWNRSKGLVSDSP